MTIKIKNYDQNKYLPKFQEGGAVEAQAPVEEPAAAPEGGAPAGGEDPLQQILMAAQQALETQDCNLAMQLCQALLQMAGGGQEAAAPAAPEGAAPVYKKGGRLSYWAKK